MTITSFVVISSKYKTDDSRSTSDFTYSIGQSIEVSAVAIKSISIPNLQYNINDNNNRLRVQTNSESPPFYDVSLPVGQYDITTFISALQTLLRTTLSDSTLTISKDALTGKLSFTNSAVPIRFSIDPSISPLAKVIGLGDAPNRTYPISTYFNFTCPYLHNLGGLKNYYLSSRILSQGFNGIFKGGDQIPLMMNIPIDVPYGVVQHYDPQDIRLNVKKFNRKNNIQWIDIKIFDEDLQGVDLNGGDIEIVLKIYSSSNPLSDE